MSELVMNRQFDAIEKRTRASLVVSTIVHVLVFALLVLGYRATPEFQPIEEITWIDAPKAPPVATPTPEVDAPAAPVETKPQAESAAKPEVSTPRPRPQAQAPVVTDRGGVGREKAREVTTQVADVTRSLDRVLESVSEALPASTSSATTTSPRRARAVRAGRSDGQIASVGGVGDLSSPDVAGSAIKSGGISIAAITDLDSGGGSTGTGSSSPATGAPGATGQSRATGGNSYRSNEALLAVVRRYAAGIQYCYENELRRTPGLRGKLVVSLVVLADGSVSEAVVVDDSLSSPGVKACVLAQIRGWQFHSIPSGVTSFKTPFIFTPPADR